MVFSPSKFLSKWPVFTKSGTPVMLLQKNPTPYILIFYCRQYQHELVKWKR